MSQGSVKTYPSNERKSSFGDWNGQGKVLLEQLKSTIGIKKVKTEELIVFTRQFYTLFKAGLSMDVILFTLRKQTPNQDLRQTLQGIQTDVENGESIANAFSKYPKIFNKLYTSMLLAGEEAGVLEGVLLELTKVLEKQAEMRREISSATLYPKIVCLAMAISLYIMLTVVIPKFATLYGKYNASLPLPTRILLGASNFATQYWYLFLGVVIGGFLLLRRYLQTPQGRLKWDQWKLKIPIFGTLFQKIEMARFGHIFSALYRSGFPILRTLEVLSGIMGNQVYVLEMRRIRSGIIKGKSLADMMRSSNKFSPMTIETTAVGEKVGNLDEMLTATASHYDLEIKHTNKNLTTMLEPILLAFIFGLVTLMLLAIFLPMWNLSSVVLHH